MFLDSEQVFGGRLNTSTQVLFVQQFEIVTTQHLFQSSIMRHLGAGDFLTLRQFNPLLGAPHSFQRTEKYNVL